MKSKFIDEKENSNFNVNSFYDDNIIPQYMIKKNFN